MDAYLDQTHADRHASAPLRDGERGEAGLARLRQTLLSIAANLWWWLRQVSGDADYENFLRSGSRHSCADRSGVSRGAVSAEEFYLENLRRKHSRINRCC